MYATEIRKRKFKESDQFFMKDNFNIVFYKDPYLIGKEEWYALEIIKFDDYETEIKRTWLYIKKLYNQTYQLAWEKLHKEDLLRKLINYENNSRIVIL